MFSSLLGLLPSCTKLAKQASKKQYAKEKMAKWRKQKNCCSKVCVANNRNCMAQVSCTIAIYGAFGKYFFWWPWCRDPGGGAFSSPAHNFFTKRKGSIAFKWNVQSFNHLNPRRVSRKKQKEFAGSARRMFFRFDNKKNPEAQPHRNLQSHCTWRFYLENKRILGAWCRGLHIKTEQIKFLRQEQKKLFMLPASLRARGPGNSPFSHWAQLHVLTLHTCSMLRHCLCTHADGNKAGRSKAKRRSVKSARVSHNKVQFTKRHSKTKLAGMQALDR